MTMLRTVDIASSAAKLLAKPMLPKLANTGQNDHSQAKTNEHLERSEVFRMILKLGHLMRRLPEIVAVRRLIKRASGTRHGGDAGPAWECGLALRLDECA